MLWFNLKLLNHRSSVKKIVITYISDNRTENLNFPALDYYTIRMKSERYLKLYGANCTSCAYTIERVGKRLSPVESVHVDISNSQAKVVFDSEESEEQRVALAKLIEVIQRIGYDATVVS